MALPELSQPQVERISKILGNEYTGSELEHHLAQCRLDYPDPELPKWKRLYNSFYLSVQQRQGKTIGVFNFIKHCFDPAQGLENPEKYNKMRMAINDVLMLSGVVIKDDGKFYPIPVAQSLGEIQRRTKELKAKLTGYGAHYEVLKCCKEELLSEDYFHAVHEAAKSLCDRVRKMSGLSLDGANLFETAFALSNPYVAYNKLQTNSERNQQIGLKEMLCGVIHMVRNITAHELRIRWDVNENDAVDILTQISYLHKLLDCCVSVPRPQ